MHRSIISLFLCVNMVAASSAFAAPKPEDLRYRATTSYGNMSRSGSGNDLDNNSISLTLSERLSGKRSQFVTLSGGLGDFTSSTQDTDNKNTSLAYGMSWGNVAPGLTLFASAYATGSWSDYNRGTATGGKDDSQSSGIGLVGGANQIIPVSAKSAISLGTGLSIGRSHISDIPTNNAGNSFGVTPYVQFDHMPNKDLHLYTRMGVMLSNRDVTLGGGGKLYTPTVGFDHKVAEVYTLGASYAHEFAPDMRGNRFNISLSRAF